MIALCCAAALSLLAPPLDGLALTPHYEDAAAPFDVLVDAAAATGAPALSVVLQWRLADVAATDIGPDLVHTQDEAVVRRIIRRARARGMAVMVFPILWLERTRAGEWRGTLRPRDRAAWWRAYERYILSAARLAAEERAAVFSVGSELSSMERDEGRWRALIAAVRRAFPGRLTYSANWDHYAHVPFWDALDLMGVTGYYRLAAPGAALRLPEMTERWRLAREHLELWSAHVERPLLLTEVGCPSQRGAAAAPWDYTGDRPVDLEVQRLAYEAFSAAWAGAPRLAGVFFWNWWGPGGPQDRGYTPRGKPAEEVLRRWFQSRQVGAR